ncbi:hypothetical protein [Sphingomonas abaci]|uniref:Uncharacterized protein n=1 Tax=Sphingomonas abaci TaxID=237611 RepID=A0A7W7AMY3_9SPHN|nr:hypothetical protein [Sphingomonas abaci]MBB4619960.1 hypothetical protein [Sphingomonas abaci]
MDTPTRIALAVLISELRTSEALSANGVKSVLEKLQFHTRLMKEDGFGGEAMEMEALMIDIERRTGLR